MTNQWTVNQNEAGQRLDVFLTSKLTDMTRSAVAKTLNDKLAAVHAFLKADDRVEFRSSKLVHAFGGIPSRGGKARSSKQNGQKAPLPRPPCFALAASLCSAGGLTGDAGGTRGETKEGYLNNLIIKETSDWIVLNKPPGLLVHPDSKHPNGTLIDLLIEHFPPLAKVGEDPNRPGIVHRLDKDVGGLMIVAKTQDAFDDLKRQFAQHATQKTYLALVHGSPPKDEGEIRFRIARSTQGGRMAARPEKDEKGKAAWTHYKIIKRDRTTTLLEVQILSGRTHQIRAHLFALNCPIVGDSLYKSKIQKASRQRRIPPQLSPMEAGKFKNSEDRLMLQSIGLSFTDPTSGERQSFTLPPDPIFNLLINNQHS